MGAWVHGCVGGAWGAGARVVGRGQGWGQGQFSVVCTASTPSLATHLLITQARTVGACEQGVAGLVLKLSWNRHLDH